MSEPLEPNSVVSQPRLTARGRFVRVAGIALLAAGILLGPVLLVHLGLFLLLLLAVALLLSRLNLVGVEYEPVLPNAVYRNQDFEVELRLRNTRRLFPAFDVEIEEEILRHLPVRFDGIPAGRDAVRTLGTWLGRRGVFTRFAYRVVSHFPLGLVCHERTGATEHRIVVFPEPRMPPDLRQELGRGTESGDYWHTRAVDLLGEFRSLREFQPGDRVKLISWPLSARLGRLIVKDMEQPGLQRCTVLFHTFQPPQTVVTHKAFERSLQILSGLFLYLRESAIPFEFLSPFNRWEPIPVHRDIESARRALWLLAEARMTVTSDFDTILRVIEANLGHAEALVIVSNTPARLWAHRVPSYPVPVIGVDTRRAVILSGAGAPA